MPKCCMRKFGILLLTGECGPYQRSHGAQQGYGLQSSDLEVLPKSTHLNFQTASSTDFFLQLFSYAWGFSLLYSLVSGFFSPFFFPLWRQKIHKICTLPRNCFYVSHLAYRRKNKTKQKRNWTTLRPQKTSLSYDKVTGLPEGLYILYIKHFICTLGLLGNLEEEADPWRRLSQWADDYAHEWHKPWRAEQAEHSCCSTLTQVT